MHQQFLGAVNEIVSAVEVELDLFVIYFHSQYIFVFKRNLRIMTYEHHPVALAGHYFYEGRPR